MSENSLSSEGKKTLSAREQDRLDQERLYLATYAPVEAEQLNLEQCAEKIAELETLYTAFEQAHDLDALYAIIELTVEEASSHSIREPARHDLPPIVALVNLLEKQEQVPKETFQRLLTRYKIIDRAVGTINDGLVDHSRP